MVMNSDISNRMCNPDIIPCMDQIVDNFLGCPDFPVSVIDLHYQTSNDYVPIRIPCCPRVSKHHAC